MLGKGFFYFHMDFFNQHLSNSIIQELSIPNANNIQVYIKREDLLHSEISGNKFRKLKYNIQQYQEGGYKGIVTMGGAFSNHIAATAYAGNHFKIQTMGLIRGEEHEDNSTLSLAKSWGMKLQFLSRDQYAHIRHSNFTNWTTYVEEAEKYWFIPEGGENEEGFKGCTEIINDVLEEYDYVVCACGTGTTLAGLIASGNKNTQYLGISALKGDFMNQQVSKLLDTFTPNHLNTNWLVLENYHGGGYAKLPSYLKDFLVKFEEKHNILLDPIYTLKMMYAVHDLIMQTWFKPNSKILCIHTGGLQGRPGKLNF